MKYAPPLDAVGPNEPYVDANPSAGIQGSIVPAAALEPGMREIVKVIEGAGLTPTDSDNTQLNQAIDIKIVKLAPTPDLSDYAKADFSNVDMPYIIETWKSLDGLSWYRKYSDGFIIQGGNGTIPTADYFTFNLLTPFISANYNIQLTSNLSGGASMSVMAKTETTITVAARANGTNYVMNFNWFACGY